MENTVDKYEKIMSGIGEWGSFYRANPNRFIAEYFGIKLKTFQEITICEMFEAGNSFFLGGLGISKTWSTALYTSTRCVLYPGTACVVASATRKQAGEIIGKIERFFIPNYPMFALEIKEIKHNQYDSTVEFKNGSTITVCTANENARGTRCNVLIIDEARLVKKRIIDSVLTKFLTAPRHAEFMDLDEYADYPMEQNQEIYLTSGWYESHWCYKKFRDYAAAMIADKKFFAIALPYQLAIKEKLLDRSRVEADMMSSDFNEITWKMEMCAEFWSGTDSTIYSYDDIAPARCIKYAFLPPRFAKLIPDKHIRIPPKLHNEVRIISADIALMQSTGVSGNNDATSVFVNQMFLNKDIRSSKNIVYTRNFEGLRTEEQALEIRRLFAEYDGDYLVIDGRGVGLPVVDALMADIYDPENGQTYNALGCINNNEIQKRCKARNAPKKIWVVMGTLEFNCQCALGLREEFRQGNIKLLGEEEDFDVDFSALSGFSKLSLEDKYRLKMPYIDTSLLIQELVKEDFIFEMEMHGYKVDWQEGHKYITFTTPDGHKCRDNKLFAEQLLRQNLEIYFLLGGCESGLAEQYQKYENRLHPKHSYTVGDGLFNLLKNLLETMPYDGYFTPPVEEHQLDKLTIMQLEMMGIKVEPKAFLHYNVSEDREHEYGFYM